MVSFGVIIGIVIFVAIVISAIRYVRRRKALQQWAEKHGWTFHDTVPNLEQTFRDFDVFGHGDGSTCYNVMRSKLGPYPVQMLAMKVVHRSTTSVSTGNMSGSNETTEAFRLVHARTKVDSPGLRLQKEHLFHRLGDKFVDKDIDFESDEFSRKYRVTAASRKFAYAAITTDMMEHLLRRPPMSIEWRGHDLVIMEQGHLEVKHLPRLLKSMQGVLKRIPRHLKAGS